MFHVLDSLTHNLFVYNMQIIRVVETENTTMRNKLNSFSNLEGGLLFFPLGIICILPFAFLVLYTICISGFVYYNTHCIFPSIGNLF